MKPAGAFFLSPFPGAVLGGAVSWATGGFPRLVSVVIFYLLLLYGVQLVFGLAIRSYLVKNRRTSAASFALGGVLMVAAPAVPYLAWAIGNRPDGLQTGLIVLALWLLCGGVTGLTCWFLAHRNAHHSVGRGSG